MLVRVWLSGSPFCQFQTILVSFNLHHNILWCFYMNTCAKIIETCIHVNSHSLQKFPASSGLSMWTTQLPVSTQFLF